MSKKKKENSFIKPEPVSNVIINFESKIILQKPETLSRDNIEILKLVIPEKGCIKISNF